MTIALAADHGGFELKQELKQWLASKQFTVKDFGANELDMSDDYPDFGRPAAEFIANDPENYRGIFICRSGQGMAVVANKIPTVRAILVGRLADFSNDVQANVLALAGDKMELGEAKQIVETWLKSLEEPLADRHQRRVMKIEHLVE